MLPAVAACEPALPAELAPAIEPKVPADVAPAAAPAMGDSAFEDFDAQATAEPPHKTAQMRAVRAFRAVARVDIGPM
jgi:hypothetical protein